MNIRAVFLLLSLLGCLPASQAKEGYPFRVITENFGHFQRILAINEGPAPIAAKVEVTTEGNAATDRPWPAYVTVPAGQSLPMAGCFAPGTTAMDTAFGLRHPSESATSMQVTLLMSFIV